MLKSACILTPRCTGDGLRVSIMSRHTQNDGRTPDKRLTIDLFDEHWPELAPPPKLVGRWYRYEIEWPDFAATYRFHLEHCPGVQPRLTQLLALALTDTVTVLCIEEHPAHCHRRLLLEYCLHLNADLDVSLA